MVDRERCRQEIASIEASIRSGHPDLEGLCLALSDWCEELRLIEQETALNARNARLGRRLAGNLEQHAEPL
jgi:hypothetical protein